jgi:hypothetical protein
MKKTIYLILGIVILQFIRPTKNLSGDVTNSIANVYSIPDDVQSILKVACNDCHSNKTVYPWYSDIQPIGWWLYNHVEGGKKHLNFDEFASYHREDFDHVLEEIIETVKKEEMPLKSYTWFGLHKEAKLTQEQRILITNWANDLRNKG